MNRNAPNPFPTSRLRAGSARIALAAAILSALGTGRAVAQDVPVIDPARGALLIHGNYCGPGNRAPRPPIDALDVACMHHDACSPARGQIPSCACNDRLHREAEAVATSSRQRQELRETAEFVADTALLLPCR